MEAIGLMPSETGQPGGKRTGQAMGDYVIAGGLFDQATKRLLASGFVISWLDRFPALPPPRAAYTPSPVSGEWMESHAEPACDDDDAILASAAWTMTPSLVEKPKAGNRSNRNKYTCPGCELNVWGKPGLRVVCGDCEMPLGESVPESEGATEEG